MNANEHWGGTESKRESEVLTKLKLEFIFNDLQKAYLLILATFKCSFDQDEIRNVTFQSMELNFRRNMSGRNVLPKKSDLVLLQPFFLTIIDFGAAEFSSGPKNTGPGRPTQNFAPTYDLFLSL